MGDVITPDFQQTPLQPGDGIYFKTVAKGPTQKAAVVKFNQGYGIGVLLGYYEPHQPVPEKQDFLVLMGRIGFVSLDDIMECLGKETMEAILDAHHLKYYGITAEQLAERKKSVAASAPNGKPEPLQNDL